MSVKAAVLRLVGLAALAVAAIGPAGAQYLPSAFETPEQELEALLRSLDPNQQAAAVALVAAAIAPSVIIPETAPSEGLEWTHFWGGRVDSAGADFAWGTVRWSSGGTNATSVRGEISVPERELEGLILVTETNFGGSSIIVVDLILDRPWSVPRIDPQSDFRFSSRLAINQGAIPGALAGGNGIALTAPDFLEAISHAAIGVAMTYSDGRTLTLMLSLGDSGRAAIDTALAAWGIAPTP